MAAVTLNEADCRTESPKLYIYLLDHDLDETINDNDMQVEFIAALGQPCKCHVEVDSEGCNCHIDVDEKFLKLLGNKNLDSELSNSTLAATERASELDGCSKQLNEGKAALNKDVVVKLKLARTSGKRKVKTAFIQRSTLTYSRRRRLKRRGLLNVDPFKLRKKRRALHSGTKCKNGNKSACSLPKTFSGTQGNAIQTNKLKHVVTPLNASHPYLNHSCRLHCATAGDNPFPTKNEDKLEPCDCRESRNCLPWVKKRSVSKKTTNLYKKKEAFSQAMMPFLDSKPAIYLRSNVKLLQRLIKTSVKQCDYLNDQVLQHVAVQHPEALQDKSPEKIAKLKLGLNTTVHRWKRKQRVFRCGIDGSWHYFKVLLLKRRRILSEKQARKMRSVKTLCKVTPKLKAWCKKQESCVHNLGNSETTVNAHVHSSVCKSYTTMNRTQKFCSLYKRNRLRMRIKTNQTAVQLKSVACKKPSLSNSGEFLKKPNQSSFKSSKCWEKQEATIPIFTDDKTAVKSSAHPLIRSTSDNLKVRTSEFTLCTLGKPTQKTGINAKSLAPLKTCLAHKLSIMILLRRRNVTFRMQLAKTLAKLRKQQMVSMNTERWNLYSRYHSNFKQVGLVQQLNLKHWAQGISASSNAEFAVKDPLFNCLGSAPGKTFMNSYVPAERRLLSEDTGYSVYSQNKMQNVQPSALLGKKPKKVVMHDRPIEICSMVTSCDVNAKKSIRPECNIILNNRTTTVKDIEALPKLLTMHNTQANPNKQEMIVPDKCTSNNDACLLKRSNLVSGEQMRSRFALDKLEARAGLQAKSGLVHKLTSMILLQRRNFSFRLMLVRRLTKLWKLRMKNKNEKRSAVQNVDFKDGIVDVVPQSVHSQQLNQQSHVARTPVSPNPDFVSEVDAPVFINIDKTHSKRLPNVSLPGKHPLLLEYTNQSVQLRSKRQQVLHSAGHRKNRKHAEDVGSAGASHGTSVKQHTKPRSSTLQNNGRTEFSDANILPVLKTIEDSQTKRDAEEEIIPHFANDRSASTIIARPFIRPNLNSLKVQCTIEKREDPTNRIRLHAKLHSKIKARFVHKLTVMILLRRRNFTFRTMLARTLVTLRNYDLEGKNQRMPHIRSDSVGIVDVMHQSFQRRLKMQHHVPFVSISANAEFASADYPQTCSRVARLPGKVRKQFHVPVKNLKITENVVHALHSQNKKQNVVPSARLRKNLEKAMMQEEICGTETFGSNSGELIQPWCNIREDSCTSSDTHENVTRELLTIQNVQFSSSPTLWNNQHMHSVSELKLPSVHDFKDTVQKRVKHVHFGQTSVVLISPRRRAACTYKGLYQKESQLLNSKVRPVKRKLKITHKLRIMSLLKLRNFAFRRQILRKLASTRKDEKFSTLKCKNLREISRESSLCMENEPLTIESFCPDTKVDSTQTCTLSTSLVMKGRFSYSTSGRHLYFVTKNNPKKKKKLKQIVLNTKRKTINMKSSTITDSDRKSHLDMDSSLSLFPAEENIKNSEMAVSQELLTSAPQLLMLPPLNPSQPYTIRIVPGLSNTVTNYRKKHPFKCSYCTPPFTTLTKDDLCFHIKTKHPERCLQCRKTFRSKTERKMHLQECLEIKEEHHCNVCQKTYYGLNRFQRHAKGKMHRIQVAVHKKALQRIIEAVTGQSFGDSGYNQTMQNYQAPRTRYFYDDSEMVELFHSALEQKDKPAVSASIQAGQLQKFWAPMSPPATEIGHEPFIAAAGPSTISVLDDDSNESYDSTISDFLRSHPCKMQEDAAVQSLPLLLNDGRGNTARNNESMQSFLSPVPESLCSFVNSSEAFRNNTNRELFEKYPNLVLNPDMIGWPSLMMPQLNCAFEAHIEPAASYEYSFSSLLQPDSSDHFMEALNEWWKDCGL